MKRVTRAHRLALAGVLLLGGILVPQVGMGLNAVEAGADTEATTSTASGSSDAPTATPTVTTDPQQVTRTPKPVVSATTVAPTAAATSMPEAEASPTSNPPLVPTNAPTQAPSEATATAEPSSTAIVPTATPEPTETPNAGNAPCRNAPFPTSRSASVYDELTTLRQLAKATQCGLALHSNHDIIGYRQTGFSHTDELAWTSETTLENDTLYRHEIKKGTLSNGAAGTVTVTTTYKCVDNQKDPPLWVLIKILGSAEFDLDNSKASTDKKETLKSLLILSSDNHAQPHKTSCPLFSASFWHQEQPAQEPDFILIGKTIEVNTTDIKIDNGTIHENLNRNSLEYKSFDKGLELSRIEFLNRTTDATFRGETCPALGVLLHSGLGSLIALNWPNVFTATTSSEGPKMGREDLKAYKVSETKGSRTRAKGSEKLASEKQWSKRSLTQSRLDDAPHSANCQSRLEDAQLVVAAEHEQDEQSKFSKLQRRFIFQSKKDGKLDLSNLNCDNCSGASLSVLMTRGFNENSDIEEIDKEIEASVQASANNLVESETKTTFAASSEAEAQSAPSHDLNVYKTYSGALDRLTKEDGFSQQPDRPTIPFNELWMFASKQDLQF